MRKPQTVVKDIRNWERKLATLQTDLEKAKGREVTAIEKKKKVVLLAKTGDEQAGKKLDQARAAELRATLEASEYNEAIEQCQGKLRDLETELVEAKKEAGKSLIAAYAKKMEEEHAPSIDKAITEVIRTVGKMQEPLTELRKGLGELDFPEVNLEHKVKQVIARFLQSSFYRVFPRDFERQHKVYREQSLTEMLKGSLVTEADQALRQKARDDARDAAIPAADFSNMRVVSGEDNMAHQALVDRMKQDASQLKAGVV